MLLEAHNYKDACSCNNRGAPYFIKKTDGKEAVLQHIRDH